MRNIFKTREEISKEACDIIGNETLEETKHKNIYFFIFEFPDHGYFSNGYDGTHS